jgi:tetratricopeptide (TPR) repeat protein
MLPLSPSASPGLVILQAEVHEMRGDSSSGDGFSGFIESIKKWGAPIVGLIVFIFGMPKVFDAAKGNITWSVLSVVGVSWLLLFWVYTSKTEIQVSKEGQLPKKEKSPKFPRLRRWVFAGMIAFPILTFSGFAIADYIEHRPSNETIILIADFQGSELKFAVTPLIINRMKRVVSKFPEVQIKHLDKVIKEGTENEMVRIIGAEHKASIVVWGFYDEALNGTAHIDQVRRTSSFSLRRNELDFNVTLPEGRGISVQEALSGDMSLLALLVVGVARYDAGAYDEAIDRFTKALDQQHSSKSESEEADVKFYLGKSLYQKGKYSEAVGRLQEVVSKRDGAPDVLDWLGWALWRAARYAEAEPLYKRALAVREKALGPEHPDTAQSLNNLALLYYSQGRYAEAEPLCKRALAVREKALGPEHPDTARSLNNLANLYGKQGRYAEAEPLYKRALAIREKALGPEHPETAQSLNNLASLYYSQVRYAEAESLCKRALAVEEKALGPEHPETAQSLNNLANLYGKQGRYAEAEPLYKRALAVEEKALGPEHPDIAQSLNNLALLYGEQGRYAEAEPLYKSALAIEEKALGPEHPDTAQVLENYADLMRKLNRESEAAKLEARAKEILEKTNRK